MSNSRRMTVLLLATAVIAALAFPVAASPRIAPTKLVVTVYYKTDTGKLPLADVEVFALVDGTPHYGCTNANGKVAFDHLGFSDVWLKALATGPSVNAPRCGNTLFLNPDNDNMMFAVFYKNHQGMDLTDSVLLDSGRNSLKLVTKTPHNQRRICAGMRVTILGSTGNDVLPGTESNDVIAGRGGNDTIDGLGGEDIICGGPGADAIQGGDDNDFLWGEGGVDTIEGEGGDDFIDGGPRGDTCLTGETLFSCEH